MMECVCIILFSQNEELKIAAQYLSVLRERKAVCLSRELYPEAKALKLAMDSIYALTEQVRPTISLRPCVPVPNDRWVNAGTFFVYRCVKSSPASSTLS